MVKGKGKDVYHRINFLYQAAHTALLVDPNNVKIIRMYGHIITMISKRTQVKLDPSIKRSICKKCHMLLYPGITSKVRLRSKRSKHIVVTCLLCGTYKRFLSVPGFELWYNKPEAQVLMQHPEVNKSTPN